MLPVPRTMPMQRPLSPYQVLNVSPDAEPEVIEAAFKVLMKKYHPDRWGGTEDRAAELNAAFSVLRDPHRRARHDAHENTRRLEMARPNRTLAHNAGALMVGRGPPLSPNRFNRRSLIAGWMCLLIVAAAAFAALIVTREPDWAIAKGIGVKIRSAADRLQNRTEPSNIVPIAAPINRGQIREALGEFERVQTRYGSVGVAAYSDACFNGLNRKRDLDDFDFCVAFDHAARSFDEGVSEPLPVPLHGFPSGRSADQSASMARLSPQEYDTIEARMADVARLTYSAIADRAKIEPEKIEPEMTAAPPP